MPSVRIPSETNCYSPQINVTTKNEILERRRLALRGSLSKKSNPISQQPQTDKNAQTSRLKVSTQLDRQRPMSRMKNQSGHNVVAADTDRAATQVEPDSKPLFGKREASIDIVKSERITNSLLSNYQIGKSIGHGAYAQVRLCIEKTQKKKFAMKIYEKHRLADQMKRKAVQREITVLKLLDH